MPSTQKPDYQRIAQHLAADHHRPGFPGETKPLALAHRFDGSLSVVAANGMKFIYTKEEVEQAHQLLTAADKPAPMPPAKPRKGRTAKKTE